MKIAGIDYGSKLAGTTVICFMDDSLLHTTQVLKGKDADAWLLTQLVDLGITEVYIDAPLSLPAAYYGEGEDYHYRASDKALQAMSPMFLGGLTARAMKLKTMLIHQNIPCKEVYPGGTVRTTEALRQVYNKKVLTTTPAMIECLNTVLPYPIAIKPTNYHQIDSILCWYIGWKYNQNKAKPYGNNEEGLIWV